MRSRSACPRVDRWPDYEGLIWVLMYLRRGLDSLGETVLSRVEAKKIRACGFEARAGCIWRCPLLPDWLVRDYPTLQPCSDELDPVCRPRAWNPQRARPIHRYVPSPIGAIEAKILRLVRMAPDQRLAKRSVQQRLSRLPATILNHVLRALSLRGYLQWRNGWLSTSGTSASF
jgi:hypothetical protein